MLGFSLAGPRSAGLATADDGSGESSTVSAGQIVLADQITAGYPAFRSTAYRVRPISGATALVGDGPYTGPPARVVEYECA